MDSENQFLNEGEQGPSTSKASTSSAPSIPPELQGLATFPLVATPTQTIYFSKPKEYREYQHPIPTLSPTPLPAHCNSTSWGRSMNPMYSPYNHPFYYPGYCRTPSAFYASSEELCVPPHAHLNNLPLARLVYRAMRYTPVYQPLLGRTPMPAHTPIPTQVPQDLTKMDRKIATRHLCQYCKKTYATPSGLSKHQQYHCPGGISSQKSFSCKQCNQHYESFEALKLHAKAHILPCKCHICDKSFSRSWLLQGHMRTHTGEKPFICQLCKRSFADRSNLRAHIQVHNNVRKYSCSVCTKSFTRMSLLLKHAEANCPAQHALMAAIEQNAAQNAQNAQSVQIVQNVQNDQNAQNIQSDQNAQNAQNAQNS